MKVKKLLPIILSVITFAFVLSGCSDFDNGWTEKELKYRESFANAFGKIDPEQDFNLATRATANVNINEAAQVKIYSLNPMINGAKLMADIPVNNTASFNFDMTEGTSEVFVQAISKRGAIINGYYPVKDGVLNISSPKLATRASEPCNTTIGDPTELKVYYSGTSYGGNLDTKSYTMYTLNNVSSSRSTPWRLGDFRKVLDEYKDANGTTKNGVFKEGKNNWLEWVKPGTLTGDVQFTTDSEGPVSVTLNYRCTSETKNQLCYFYYTGNNYPTPENIKLYCLIPNATADNDLVRQIINEGASYTKVSGATSIWSGLDDTMIQGTTFDLVYFEDGKDPSFSFPPDVHIGFAIVKDIYENSTATADQQSTSDKIWFSIQGMNIPSTNWSKGTNYDNQNFPAAATFKMGDVTFFGFEDYPELALDDGGSDLNDLLFFVVGNFKEDIPDLDPDPVAEAQDWMLIFEDLGNSLDWDYNDIVLKVAHTTGSNKLIITPMAASGTLASYVKFNDTNVGVGEIHQLFGASAAESGKYDPINADSRADGTPVEITLTAEQDEAFTMTTLGAIDELGGISLHVVPEGNVGETGIQNSTVIAYSLDNKGNAPEVICVPASWNYTNSSGQTIKRTFCWPAELKHIDDVYPRFKSWVANKKVNTSWYTDDPNPSYCVSGTFDVEVSEPTGGESGGEGGNTGGSTNPSIGTPYNISIDQFENGGTTFTLPANAFVSTATSATITITNNKEYANGWSVSINNESGVIEKENWTTLQSRSFTIDGDNFTLALEGKIKVGGLYPNASAATDYSITVTNNE